MSVATRFLHAETSFILSADATAAARSALVFRKDASALLPRFTEKEFPLEGKSAAFLYGLDRVDDGHTWELR